MIVLYMLTHIYVYMCVLSLPSLQVVLVYRVVPRRRRLFTKPTGRSLWEVLNWAFSRLQDLSPCRPPLWSETLCSRTAAESQVRTTATARPLLECSGSTQLRPTECLGPPVQWVGFNPVCPHLVHCITAATVSTHTVVTLDTLEFCNKLWNLGDKNFLFVILLFVVVLWM